MKDESSYDSCSKLTCKLKCTTLGEKTNFISDLSSLKSLGKRSSSLLEKRSAGRLLKLSKRAGKFYGNQCRGYFLILSRHPEVENADDDIASVRYLLAQDKIAFRYHKKVSYFLNTFHDLFL